MSKTIILGADHNGVDRKALVISYLKSIGYTCVDFGGYSSDVKIDYVDVAQQIARNIGSNVQYGILICGTGQGMAIASGKYAGVRPALCHTPFVAQKAKEHNNSNVLCMGAWLSDEEQTLEIVSKWLNEPYAEGRHVKRVERIDSHTGVVLANGVFDVLHKGHIELLKFAKTQGSHLVVAIDSDSRVRQLKGENRPINNEEDRKKLLEAIGYVDEVIVFNTAEELRELYKNVCPSVIVKGGEWTADEVRQRDQIPQEINVKIYPVVDSYSTTNTLKKIQALTTCEKKSEV
jgi:ribose 5-phosphate isomerase B